MSVSDIINSFSMLKLPTHIADQKGLEPLLLITTYLQQIYKILEHDVVIFFDAPDTVFCSVHIVVITFDRSFGWEAVDELIFVVFIFIFKFFIDDEEYFALGNKLETFFVGRFISRDSVEFVI